MWRWFPPAFLGIAFLIKVLYLLGYRHDPLSQHLLHDAQRYHDWAKVLAAGEIWESGAFYQAPLYPTILSIVYRLTGSNPWVAYTFQALLGLLTLWLVWRVTHRAYGQTASAIAMILTALYLPFVFFETKVLGASLAVFLATLLMDRMQAADPAARDWSWFIPGFVAGLASVANPAFLLMAFLATLWILLDPARSRQYRLRRIAWLLAGIALVVLPVTARNYRLSGEWIPISANGGVTFAHGNNPNAMGVFSVPPGLSGRIQDQRQETRQVAESSTGQELGDGAVSSFWFREGLEFIRKNPGRWLILERDKILFALANDEQPLEYNSRLDRNPYRWLFPVPFALILALAVLRLLEGPRSRRSEQPIFIVVATIFTALLIFYVSGRYRLPSVTALAAMAGWGGSLVVQRFKREPRSGILPVLLVVVVGLVSLAYVPLRYQELRSQQDAMGLLDRGAALWEAGQGEEALAAVERSIELDPLIPGRYLDLARVLAQLGRTDEAERAVRESLHRDSSNPQAHFELGVLSVRAGRLEDAASAFATTFRLDPSSANAANNLLGTLVLLERLAEAHDLLRLMESRGLMADSELEKTVRQADPIRDP